MTRPEAPDFVLTARAVGSLSIILAYAALRVPMLGISGTEFVGSWLGAIVLLWVFERSASELYLRQWEASPAVVDKVLALRSAFDDTAIVADARRWPDETELTIAEARHEATHALIDQGRITEHLFTHDVLCEPTPPSGFELPQLTPGVPGWTSELPNAYVGRHRPEQIDRDRFGQLFGSL